MPHTGLSLLEMKELLMVIQMVRTLHTSAEITRIQLSTVNKLNFSVI